MKEVFADTFYFLAILDSAATHHAQARAATAAQSARLVTTAWVLIELANSLSRRAHRQKFLTTLERLRSDPGVLIIDPEPALYEAGIHLYAAQSDKDWSLTDCISFVVMERRGITNALTGDHHFEQAGFRALLK